MKRKRKRNNRKTKPFFWFFITFSLVLLLGLSGILISMVLTNGNGHVNEAERHTLPWEKIQDEEQVMSERVETEDKGKYSDVLSDEAYLREHRIIRLEEAVESEVNLLFAGDILFDDEYAVMANALRRGGRVEDAFSAELLQKMRAADIFMVNNEFPYTNRGTPVEDKQFTFRADTDKVSWLFDMGVDIVSLANNHIFDFGEVGLLDTLETLENAKMSYVGAGRNIKEASAPVYIMTENIKIGIVSATQIERLDNPDTRGATEAQSGVFRCLYPELLYQVVEETRANCDFLIVFIHWGTENTDKLDWAQLEQAPKLAEAGADLVIGAHPHCLQEIGYCGEVPVIYSLGNFWFNSKRVDTGMMEVVVGDDGIKSMKFIPVLQEDCRSTLLEGEEKAGVLNVMRGLSERVIIDEEGTLIKSE